MLDTHTYNSSFTFVRGSHGNYEGNSYDNVELSNGLGIIKFKNKTGTKYDTLEVGQSVEVEFQLIS